MTASKRVAEQTPDAPIRVMLAEDHTIVREGLVALLQSCADVEVVGQADDGQKAVELARQLRPDVIVMDVGLPTLNGVDATQRIREELPDTRVVMLSMHATEEYVRPAMRAGAQGYLLKGSGLSDLVSAIRSVSAGEAFFSPPVAALLLRPDEGDAKNALTPREREVVRLVADGLSSPAIGEQLGVSTKTVEAHRSRAMAKAGVSNVAGLVRYAMRHGLVSSGEG